MRGLLSRLPPSALFRTLRPAADPQAGAASAPRHGLLESPHDRRGLLSGILQSVGVILGFGNNQAHPSDPKDPGSGGPSTPSSHDPTSVHSPADQPSPPAHAPPASYPAPGGGGQGERPTSSAPASVSPAPQSSSAGTEAGPAPHSTPPSAAMNVVPTLSTVPARHDSSYVPTDYTGATAASPTVSPGWSSVSHRVSSAPSPTDPPTTAAHTKGFPQAAAAAISALLGFLVVSALFWAVWLALRKRRRTYPEFATVHPKWTSVPESVGAGENPFAHPRDEKEEDPFDAGSLWRASTARSLASTLSV